MSQHEAFLRQHLAKYSYTKLTYTDCTNLIAVYRDLRPKNDHYVFNDGTRKELISLDGTIPVNYKGAKYNIPVCIWLMDTHPYNAPMAFVKPTSDMLVKPSKYVDANGRVYLPYLHEWRHPTSDLVGLVQVMCVIFGENSPLYSRTSAHPPYRPSYPPGQAHTGLAGALPYPTPITPSEVDEKMTFPIHKGTENEYNMTNTRRGKAFIINNKLISRESPSHGTEVDCGNLIQVYETLGFEVVQHNDCSAGEIMTLLRQLSQEDHRDADCIIVAILSHGDNRMINGIDGESVQICNLTGYFSRDKCRSLIGKPKLFFIQACEGTKFDPGVQSNLEVDSPAAGSANAFMHMPAEADFLVCLSTIPGLHRFQDHKYGSWFIKALCEVFQQHAVSRDLEDMLMMVKKKVAHEYSHSVDMQIPLVTSTLVKKVYF
ncbi:caspase-3-like [Ptychodera flava]|uniref:caspase-3-like n=1 Tax=Ptychodera flava TaxID=63121 RepID=UPI003969CABD